MLYRTLRAPLFSIRPHINFYRDSTGNYLPVVFVVSIKCYFLNAFYVYKKYVQSGWDGNIKVGLYVVIIKLINLYKSLILLYKNKDRCWSRLINSLGKRVYGNVPRVRIPLPPPH